MIFQEAILNWGENPLSVSQIKSSNEVMGWGEKAIEIRSIDRGLLNGVFMHKRPNKLKFLTEKNDKVFFASVQSPTNSQGRGLQYFSSFCFKYTVCIISQAITYCAFNSKLLDIACRMLQTVAELNII